MVNIKLTTIEFKGRVKPKIMFIYQRFENLKKDHHLSASILPPKNIQITLLKEINYHL